MPVKKNRKSLILSIEAALKREVKRQTNALEKEAVDLVLNSEKTGKVYRRNSVEHKSSAPGEPFASDTGQTIKQFDTEIRDGGLEGLFVARGKNAKRLELGTENMEPRPFARPALSNRKDAIEKGLAKALKRGIRNAG